MALLLATAAHLLLLLLLLLPGSLPWQLKASADFNCLRKLARNDGRYGYSELIHKRTRTRGL